MVGQSKGLLYGFMVGLNVSFVLSSNVRGLDGLACDENAIIVSAFKCEVNTAAIVD